MRRIICLFAFIPTICIGQNDASWEKPSWWNEKGSKVENVKKDAKWSKKESTIEVDSDLVVTIKQNIFILQQDYSLYNKKEDEYYGYDNQDQFGSIFSVGIRCKGFNLLSDKAIHPWNYDVKYEHFKKERLIPTITRSRYRLLGDSISHYNNLDTIATARQAIKENQYYTSAPFTTSQEGMLLNSQDTCKSGYIVWFVLEKGSLESEDSNISFVASHLNTEMFGSVVVTPPSDLANIVGGIFVTESQVKTTPYHLAGMLNNKDDKWVLEFPFKGFQTENNNEPVKIGKLTKIKKDKNKKME